MNKIIKIEKMGEPIKQTKTFPKGVLKKTEKLKLKGVRDPAKSPPFKKGMRKHTLRLLTSKGMKQRNKTQRNKIRGLSDDKVKEILKTSGLVKNPNTPKHIAREILGAGVEAGFVSV